MIQSQKIFVSKNPSSPSQNLRGDKSNIPHDGDKTPLTLTGPSHNNTKSDTVTVKEP